MKKQLTTALIGVVCLWSCNMSKADMLIQLYPANDAYINSDEPGSVHNSDTLYAGYIAEITRSYLMFDLSVIPSGQSIVSAVLRLDTNFLSAAPVIGAYYLENDNWSESTLTWNNAPTNFNIFPADTQLVGQGEVFWNVNSDVSLAYGIDNTYSVVMKLPNEVPGTQAGFWSKDAGIANYSPYLSIQYKPIPEPATLLLLGFACPLGGGLIRKKRGA